MSVSAPSHASSAESSPMSLAVEEMVARIVSCEGNIVELEKLRNELILDNGTLSPIGEEVCDQSPDYFAKTLVGGDWEPPLARSFTLPQTLLDQLTEAVKQFADNDAVLSTVRPLMGMFKSDEEANFVVGETFTQLRSLVGEHFLSSRLGAVLADMTSAIAFPDDLDSQEVRRERVAPPSQRAPDLDTILAQFRNWAVSEVMNYDAVRRLADRVSEDPVLRKDLHDRYPETEKQLLSVSSSTVLEQTEKILVSSTMTKARELCGQQGEYTRREHFVDDQALSAELRRRLAYVEKLESVGREIDQCEEEIMSLHASSAGGALRLHECHIGGLVRVRSEEIPGIVDAVYQSLYGEGGQV